jgi:hypothetical protein
VLLSVWAYREGSMNQEQLRLSIQSIFDELKDTGLDINSSVYRKLMAVYSDSKIMREITDKAMEDSVALFCRVRKQEETIARLKDIINSLTPNNPE